MNIVRSAIVLASLISTSIAVASCANSTEPIVPDNVSIAVDSAVYHLQPTKYGYAVNLTVTVVNSSNRDIYLGQFCGSWGVSRADGTQTWLGSYACAVATSGVARLVIPAGQRYVTTFYLPASIQPQARPQITLDDNLGTMVFSYSFVNSSGTKSAPLKSGPFQVLPPV